MRYDLTICQTYYRQLIQPKRKNKNEHTSDVWKKSQGETKEMVGSAQNLCSPETCSMISGDE